MIDPADRAGSLGMHQGGEAERRPGERDVHRRSWLDRIDDNIDELRRARQLQQAGRSAEASVILDRVLATTTDPSARADALVQRLGALINLGRMAEYTVATDEAFAAVRDLPDPYLRGQMHAFAALGASLQGKLDRGVTHLVQASRALAGVPDGDEETAWGWHDLAMAYSYLGFHGHALTAIEQARQVGAGAGSAPGAVRGAGDPAAQRGLAGPPGRRGRLPAGAARHRRRAGPVRRDRRRHPVAAGQPGRLRVRDGPPGGAR